MSQITDAIKVYFDNIKKLPNEEERRNKKLNSIVKKIINDIKPYIDRIQNIEEKEEKEEETISIKFSTDYTPKYTIPKKTETFEIKRDESNTCRAKIWGPNKEYPRCNRYRIDGLPYCKIHNDFRPFGQLEIDK